MKNEQNYENYPLWIVLIANIFSISIYTLGFFILFKISWVTAVLYLIYALVLEYRLLSRHCVNCYYWGKSCGFGKGKISSIFLERGDISQFCTKQMTWKDMIPDFIVPLFPIVTGIVLLFLEFDFFILFLVILLFLLMTFGNQFIRGSLTCKYCKQRELGCPADKLFEKK